MPITRYPYPNSLPTDQQDFVKQNNLLITGFFRVNEPSSISGANVTKGAVFQIGGVIYYCTADTAIGGAASNYVKISPDVGGATCTASYVANLVGVSWNQAYNGYYDVGGNLYVFDEGRALQAGQIAAVVQRYLRQDRTGDVYVGRDLISRDVLPRDVVPTRKIDCYKAGEGAADVQLKQLVTGGAGTSAAFNVKKPISCYMSSSCASSGVDIQRAAGFGAIISHIPGAQYFSLCPGTYRLANDAAGTTTLYALGVYGDVAITAADIVT
jgi:hypothetical protein